MASKDIYTAHLRTKGKKSGFFHFLGQKQAASVSYEKRQPYKLGEHMTDYAEKAEYVIEVQLSQGYQTYRLLPL